jgi:transposase
MKYIVGTDRSQINLFPVSLDQSIEHDNEVRLIDLFVNGLPLEDYGFEFDFGENGRPGYHPRVLLKLFIYGYLNRIRSSRCLEKESKRNIELMWLLEQLQPDHNTISNFRRDNKKGIKRVFRATVELAKNFDLIGGKLLAGDSTKFRAQNSKKNNYNQKKINRHLEYIEKKLESYHEELAKNDGDNEQKEQIKLEIQKQEERKANYKSIEQQIQETGQEQVSTSDPDSRQMIVRNNITEVAYNAQSTVDSKHNIPIDYKVTNRNDSKAMGGMLRRAKSILGTNIFIALYDKGYHTGSEFKTAHNLGVEVLVAIPSVAAQAPNPKYNVENFNYDKQEDCYICPEKNKLQTTGNIHKAKTYNFKRYVTKACIKCPVKHDCSKAKYGKAIQRSEYQELIETNKKRIENNKDYYRKRQSIVEHPYGTIKRQWGFSYILTKRGIDRAESDVGLMFTAYNLRRIINIIGVDMLKKYLESMLSNVFYIFYIFKLILSPYGVRKYFAKSII